LAGEKYFCELVTAAAETEINHYGGINKQVEASGKEAHDVVGKNLPVEYPQGHDDHLQTHFQKEGNDQLSRRKKTLQFSFQGIAGIESRRGRA